MVYVWSGPLSLSPTSTSKSWLDMNTLTSGVESDGISTSWYFTILASSSGLQHIHTVHTFTLTRICNTYINMYIHIYLSTIQNYAHKVNNSFPQKYTHSKHKKCGIKITFMYCLYACMYCMRTSWLCISGRCPPGWWRWHRL